MMLYTLPTLPLVFILKDAQEKYWIVPATASGQPRVSYAGNRENLYPVPRHMQRVLLAAWEIAA